MILNIILSILVCLLIYFLSAKRFKVKRLIIYIVSGGIFRAFKSRMLKIWEEGITTIVSKKFSKFLNQPYYCKVVGNESVIKYEFCGKNYKIFIKQRPSIRKSKYFILEHKDGTGKREDVTSKLQPWIGPNHDFHNTTLTPRDLGYKKLIVFFSIGDKITINENDQLPTNLIK